MSIRTTRLTRAVSEGRFTDAETILSHGDTVDATFDGGKTSLTYLMDSTSTIPKVSMARFLISHGANVNHREPNGITAILILVGGHMNNEHTIDALLEAGANPDLGGVYFTPLQYACRWNRVSYVKKLLDAGASVGYKGTSMFTPLAYACYYGKAESVRLLIEHGADIYTPFYLQNIPCLKPERTKGVRRELVIANNKHVCRAIKETTVRRPNESGGLGDTTLLLPLPIVGGHVVLYDIICDYIA